MQSKVVIATEDVPARNNWLLTWCCLRGDRERNGAARISAAARARLHGAGGIRIDSEPAGHRTGQSESRGLPSVNGNRISDEAYVEPRTLVEEELVKILAPLLKVDRVGVNDNFFLLGGHSLLGTQVIARVSETSAST